MLSIFAGTVQPRKAGAATSLSCRNLATQQLPPLAQFAPREKLGFSSEDIWVDSETLAEVRVLLSYSATLTQVLEFSGLSEAIINGCGTACALAP